MLISELPQPYKALAEKRREGCITRQYTESLRSDFIWGNTKEGHNFWSKCYYAKTESELPPYPYE